MTLAGHGRLEAAKLVGLSEVPVIVLEGLSEAKKRALVLADNKIAENAGVRPSLVKVRYGSKRTLPIADGVGCWNFLRRKKSISESAGRNTRLP